MDSSPGKLQRDVAQLHNEFNGSDEYSFACKHDGTLFFPDTNGGDNTGTTNKKVRHYAPLQQLFKDLQNNTVARYNLITPDEYNDMHSNLAKGFVYQGVRSRNDLARLRPAITFCPLSFLKSWLGGLPE